MRICRRGGDGESESGRECRKMACGLVGEDWIASSRVREEEGEDVMLKPPAEGRVGMWRSRNWPGRNCVGWWVLGEVR